MSKQKGNKSARYSSVNAFARSVRLSALARHARKRLLSRLTKDDKLTSNDDFPVTYRVNRANEARAIELEFKNKDIVVIVNGTRITFWAPAKHYKDAWKDVNDIVEKYHAYRSTRNLE